MANIYRYSQVNIAGPAASNSETGFWNERAQPLKSNWTISRQDEHYTVTILHWIQYDPYLPEGEQDSPLANRGWVLQERLLSPRTLYFGTKRTYFECCTNTRHENLHFPYVGDYQQSSELQKRDFRSLTSEQSALKFWAQLIVVYTEMALTFPNDRLPAVSAIARQVQPLIRSRYLAGIWESDIPRGLSWYIPHYRWKMKEVSQSAANSCIAPSWSWISAKLNASIPVVNYSIHFRTAINNWDAQVDLESDDEFGRVKGGTLKLRGKILTLDVYELQDNIVSTRLSLYLRHPELEDSIVGRYELDEAPVRPEIQQPEPVYSPSSTYPLLQSVQFLYLGQWPASNEWAALAIQPVEGNEQLFRRIGMAHRHDYTASSSLATLLWESGRTINVELV